MAIPPTVIMYAIAEYTASFADPAVLSMK